MATAMLMFLLRASVARDGGEPVNRSSKRPKPAPLALASALAETGRPAGRRRSLFLAFLASVCPFRSPPRLRWQSGATVGPVIHQLATAAAGPERNRLIAGPTPPGWLRATRRAPLVTDVDDGDRRVYLTLSEAVGEESEAAAFPRAGIINAGIRRTARALICWRKHFTASRRNVADGTIAYVVRNRNTQTHMCP